MLPQIILHEIMFTSTEERVYIMSFNYKEMDQFVDAICEDSKQHSIDGTVSYPYVVGTLQSLLQGSLDEYLREVVVEQIKGRI